ncbi:energy-coupling factor transporter transmembrane protein EcfT [Mesorhizobium sp. SB112]|uniref:energy-coupling factor transporter transmembrane protein EcfT n=1 Tax=Mesorhizobium sp. SB112 TaxID=3151853 RepID=UPI003262D42D
MLNSLYVEGRGPLHRLSAGAKLAFLALAGLGLFFIHSPLVLAAAFALAAAVYFTVGLAAGAMLRRIRPTLYSLLFLMLLNLFFLPWEEVVVLALRILTLVFAAAAITATTPLGDMMNVVNRLLSPLERLGLVRPGDAGLMVGLCLRFVPEILSRYHALVEAHKARGMKVRPLKLLGPLVILTLKQADDVAAAIDARGLRAARTDPVLSLSKESITRP